MIALLFGGAALLLTTWVLFPAALLFVARLHRPRPLGPLPADAPAPLVSAVLATRDPLEVIATRVADLLAQDYPADRLEVIVALDASAAGRVDETRAAFSDPRVRVVAGDAPAGKPGALNAGVRAAQGELLLFADARQRFAPDVTRRLVGALVRDASLGAISGTVVRPGTSSAIVRAYAEYDQRIREAEARIDSSVGVMGAIYAARRAVWPRLPDGLILDDLYVPMRIVLEGRRVGVDLEAVAFETRATDGGAEAVRKVRTLTGNYQLMAWLPRVLVPWRNRVWTSFIGHKVLRLTMPLATAAMGIGALGLAAPLAATRPALLAVGLVVIGASLAIGRVRSLVADVLRMHWAAALAFGNGVRGRWHVWR